MAEKPRRMSVGDYVTGIVVVIVVFLLLFFAAGALGLNVPQWLLSGIAGGAGVIIWFALIGRFGGAKK